MNIQHLIKKYHVPAPRYTSYPTVPYWNSEPPTLDEWTQSVQRSFRESNTSDGISLYVHLPFCESLCTYCGCNTRITKNHQVEEPYINAVLAEWQLYCNLFAEKPLIREIHLGGGTPTFFAHQNLRTLITGLLSKGNLHSEAEFSFEAHPNNTTAEHLQTLYDLGFRRLSLGIQDFDPEVQLIINRLQSFEQVKDVTDQARKTGYTSINYDLIYGLPLQTLMGLEATIRKVITLLPDRIAFYSYAHVPWVKPGQRRYNEEHLPSAEAKQELYELGRTMLTDAGYKEIGMDHFALGSDSLYEAQKSGNLHRNFMGYTHQYTQLMVSLGVSSISDTWFAFAQNVKKVEDYIQLVNNNVFPIFKGHILSSTDLTIRKHILNLMCTGTTSWSNETEPPEELFKGLERIQEMVKDGLVDMTTSGLTIKPAGWRFLRNICMAFDARLHASEPSAQLFSMTG